MSNTWISHIYFPQYKEWPDHLVEALTNSLASAGLVFPEDGSQYKSYWFSIKDASCYHVGNLREALILTKEDDGGIFDFINLETEMYASLHLCLAGNHNYPATSAEATCGFIGLSVQYAYLHDEPKEVITRRYQLIFKWCRIIALISSAIYGWGDLETQVGDTNFAVSASDLASWNIPRLSWWSYYNKEYLKYVARKLHTAANWAEHNDDNGLTIIAHPPGEITYPTTQELIDWYVV